MHDTATTTQRQPQGKAKTRQRTCQTQTKTKNTQQPHERTSARCRRSQRPNVHCACAILRVAPRAAAKRSLANQRREARRTRKKSRQGEDKGKTCLRRGRGEDNAQDHRKAKTNEETVKTKTGRRRCKVKRKDNAKDKDSDNTTTRTRQIAVVEDAWRGWASRSW